ncbi:MAG: glycoside hydrolase family 28 protein, partial [Prevotella sp.]|nr:glycoside hydrolase family 28 protein [Prevotella sp.]
MTKKLFALLLAIALPMMLQARSKAPFKMPEVARPAIPANTVTLTDFGAKGDGATLCTDAFASAMKKLASMGGGRLEVPAGIWLTGPIQFESNVELHTAIGSLILFTDDYNAYPER